MLSTEEIKSLIDQDSKSSYKKQAKVGQAYYEGEHDILKSRLFYYNSDGKLVEDTTRSNIKIPHPFFTELVDQLSAYMLSFDTNPIRAREGADGLQDHLDTYFDEEFWTEAQDLITGTNAKGFEYVYGYKGPDDMIRFQCADSLGVVEVKATETASGCAHIIYRYNDGLNKAGKKITRIRVFDRDQIWFYVQIDGGAINLDPEAAVNPCPNVVWTDPKDGKMYGSSLGFLPFWRLDNCQKRTSGLKPIKPLIDDYDLMECSLSNNLQDFDTPIHVVTGYSGDNLDELQTNLKTKKIVGVEEGGSIDVKTVDVPYQARKTKADEDEKNIYRFGMGFNSSQVGDGNVTNVVIRSRYTLLALKSGKLEKRFKRLLKDLIRVVLDEINSANGTGFSMADVEIVFEHIIPTNEKENAEIAYTEAQTEQLKVGTILQAAGLTGDEAALKAICELLDMDFDKLKDQLQDLHEVNNFLGAAAALEGADIDGAGDD